MRTAIFDLDGTLIDSLSELHEGVRRFAERSDLPDPGRQNVGDMVGAGVLNLGARLCAWWKEAAGAVLDRDRTVEALVAEWQSIGGALLEPFPDAFESVEALRAAGWRTALATNKPWEMTERLMKSRGWDVHFDVMLAPSGTCRPKPEPDLLLEAARLTNAEPQRCVMVGDSRNDALGARRAGMPAYLVSTGYNEGEPIEDWARENGFPHVYASMRALCTDLLRLE